MKYLSFLCLSFIILGACEKNTSDNLGAIEEVGNIASDYVDTLETSIIDAKTVTDVMNTQQEALEESLDIK